jgi:hypothetical protein
VEKIVHMCKMGVEKKLEKFLIFYLNRFEINSSIFFKSIFLKKSLILKIKLRKLFRAFLNPGKLFQHLTKHIPIRILRLPRDLIKFVFEHLHVHKGTKIE